MLAPGRHLDQLAILIYAWPSVKAPQTRGGEDEPDRDKNGQYIGQGQANLARHIDHTHSEPSFL
jgi:hypothetical protein